MHHSAEQYCGYVNVTNVFCFRNALELALSKSKSQCGIAAIGDESINEKKSRKTNLRRSHTHSEAVMPRNIAEIRAKLQQNGENDWKKRIAQNNSATNELKLLTEKNRYNVSTYKSIMCN